MAVDDTLKKVTLDWPMVIVILIIVASVLAFFLTPLGKIMIGLKDILLAKPAAYSDTNLIDKEATDSMSALMYSVNRLAWFDTYYGRSGWGFEDGIDFDDLKKEVYVIDEQTGSYQSLGTYESFGRTYGATQVQPTIMDAYLVPFSGTDDEASKQVAKLIVDCLIQGEDVGMENIRCFGGDFEGLRPGDRITKDSIKRGLEALEDDETLCQEGCQKYLNDVLGINGDIWSAIGDLISFNWVSNYAFEVEGDAITSENSISGSKEIVQICLENGENTAIIGGLAFLVPDRIYVTDDMDMCRSPKDALKFTFKISNFNFPQSINRATGLAGISQSLMNHYGDPYYITYYEKFPDDEDSTWKGNAISGVTDVMSRDGILLFLKWIIPSKIDNILLNSKVIAVVGNIIPRLVDIVDAGIDGSTGQRMVDQAPSIAGQYSTELNDAVMSGDTFDYSYRSMHPEDLEEYFVVKYAMTDFLDRNFNQISQQHEGIDYMDLKSDYVKEASDAAKRAYDSGTPALSEGRISDELASTLVYAFDSIGGSNHDLNEDLVGQMSDWMELNSDSFSLVYRVSSSVNDRMIEYSDEMNMRRAEGWTEQQIHDDIIGEFDEMTQGNMGFVSGLNKRRADAMEFSRKRNIALAMAIEEQNMNQGFAQGIGSAVDTASLDRRFDDMFSGVTVTQAADDTLAASVQAGAKRLGVTRTLITFFMKIESIGDKYRPLGVNSIGFKTPYRGAVLYDDQYTRNWQWPTDKGKYLDYFENFGGYEGEEVQELEIEDHGEPFMGENCNAQLSLIDAEYYGLNTEGTEWKIGRTYCGKRGTPNADYAYYCDREGPDRVQVMKARCDSGCNLEARNCEGAAQSCSKSQGCPEKQYCDEETRTCKLNPVYSSKKYKGLLPEVEQYFLALQGDKFRVGIFNQPYRRFHIVSPCRANVLIKVTQCECFGSEEEPIDINLGVGPVSLGRIDQAGTFETGKYNKVLDEVVPHFDGQNPSLYSIDPDTGAVVKECMPKSAWNYVTDLSPWADNPAYRPMCIEINPVMDPDLKDNYCYKGATPPNLIADQLALEWGLPIACGLVGTGSGPGALVLFAACDVVGQLTYSMIENFCTHWPIHGWDGDVNPLHYNSNINWVRYIGKSPEEIGKTMCHVK